MCVFQKSVSEINDDSIGNKINMKGPIKMENLDFGTNISKLKEIMQLKSIEAKEKLEQDFNGIEGLSQKLCSNLRNGIEDSPEEIKRRIQIFGINEIKANKPKSFLVLAVDAVQDPTLIMLIICAIISIGLSFYHPEVIEVDEEYSQSKKSNESNLEWVEGK
jgi:Ca2+ transporting ATPase